MRAIILLLALFTSAVVEAATPAVPANLDAWRGWVLKDQEFRNCPLIAGSRGASAAEFLCSWPGDLKIDAGANGAAIQQRWHVEVDGWVPLPGSHQHWPQQVTVDGRPAAVVDRTGPSVWLAAGDHELRAQMSWADRPQSLQVPASIALVSLLVDGKLVAPLQRSGNQLTLGRGAAIAVEADRVDLHVFRLFRDDIPGELTTRIRIDASGQAREETFGPALPEGFVPLALQSDAWPARLDDEGILHVQVQPGSNTVTLTARAAAPVTELTARVPGKWAAQEIWSYESVPALRVTSISGVLQVDPRQADVPDEWAGFPAYAMNDGDHLSIEQRSRGLDEEVANRLNLQREIWLDFSGNGWFAKDRLGGMMQSGWRFDLAAPFSLQRAQVLNSRDGNDALLITKGDKPGLSGVEWRTAQVSLGAGLRVDSAAHSMPVSGWQQTFDQVATTVHLPFGYRLIAAPGTDQASGSWMSRWTLLDVFLAAIIILLGARLFGWMGGALTALYLLLGYQEGGSPLWTLLCVFALGLILRALPQGRLASATALVRIAAVVVLLMFALPFAAGQLRLALYPQLESQGVAVDFAQTAEFDGQADGFAAQEAAPMMEAPMPVAPPPPAPSAGREYSKSRAAKLNSTVASLSAMQRQESISKYSQSTVVQTGAGEPGWRLGSTYRLSWSGPVLADQQVHMLIASPWMVRLLRVLLVGALAWLLWRIVRGTSWRWRASRVNTVAGVLMLGVSLLCIPLAQAQDYPSEALLQQLQARLTEAPQCAPQCANLANAEISISGDQLRVALEIHALARVAVPIPADDKSLSVRSITIDAGSNEVVLSHSGKSWIAIDRGVHRVVLNFAISGDRIALAFPMTPERVRVAGDAWQASGLADERLLTETLTLVRARADKGEELAITAQRFPPYVRVHRSLSLDLDWRVQNTVERLAPRDGGFAVNLPLIAGEHVSTPGLKVRDGKVTIGLGDGEVQATWQSTLEQTESLALSAPDLGSHAEVWKILVSPTWHVEFSGVPESGSSAAGASGDYHEFEFHPLPGETLTLRVSKPAAVDGATRAIDSLNLSSDFGLRARTHALKFDMRASQGGEQVISLPKDAELLTVTRDGVNIGARMLDGKLSLPINPGAQKYDVRFRENAEMSSRIVTPEVSLGLPAANVSLAIKLPNDRWLLAAFGPPVGPAVLFWGELLVAILLAWLLSRWRKGPLRFHHWLLLVLGFSTFSWLALLVVVGWLFALDWRARTAPEANWKFNLAQLGLVVLSLIALVCLFESIRNGLLGSPDMVVRGNGSYANQLQWFADRSIDALPDASVISLPLSVYNVVMLFWALWLAWAVVGWFRNGFAAWMSGGYWRPWRKPANADIDLPEAVPPAVE
ncbi:MAG TPA: hypothetical protein VFN25_02745 [Dokdonella sp.]|uniref:hypothetical protein n=1 Tax=Dokdonella sp. TaxID=2291710 RepID=UPI002D80D910|nr:hypothetical protein [Dokdonella sp.]HET9031803.1 hypothetical protein [Dokdonella sp.]